MKKIRLGLAVLATMVGAASVSASIFTGASGLNKNFSTAGNWDVVPTNGALIDAFGVTNASVSSPAIVDSAWTNTVANVKLHSVTGYGSGTSYVEVVSGGNFKVTSLAVGNAANAAFDGVLTVRKGGAITNMFANSGVLSIGGGTAGMVGKMFVEAGASLRQTRVDLNQYGLLSFTFDSNSVSTLNLSGTSVLTNKLDGLLQVDLAALTTSGTYTLINSTNSNLLIGGTMRTWLDGVGGSYTNTGDFANANFQVLNGGTKKWTLALADGNQDLTLTVIPEPTTISLFIVAGIGAFALRRVVR